MTNFLLIIGLERIIFMGVYDIPYYQGILLSGVYIGGPLAIENPPYCAIFFRGH